MARMRLTANFLLNDDRNVQFFIRVRKASDLFQREFPTAGSCRC